MNLILEISDTGIGIPKAQQEHIVGAFTQVAGQSTPKFGGADLGLTITNRSAEMLRGVITVQSEPGQGSTFRFTFLIVTITELTEFSTIATGGEGDFIQFAQARILRRFALGNCRFKVQADEVDQRLARDNIRARWADARFHVPR